VALGRQEQVQKFNSALLAIVSNDTPAQIAGDNSAAAPAKAKRARKRISS
jgi:hypothetical protein